jgi:hypothetical protein
MPVFDLLRGNFLRAFFTEMLSMFPSYALGEKDLHISPLRNYHNYIGVMD